MTKLVSLFVLFCFAVAVNAQAPAVTSFSPSGGQVGTIVTLTGTNLGAATAVNIGGVNTVVLSNTATQITAFVMPGAATGSVSVTTAGGTGTAAGSFTITAVVLPNTQQGAKLVGLGAANATAYQGRSVAISADGNTLAVGAPEDNLTLGAVWVFTRSGSTWTQQGGKLVGTGNEGTSYQGASVALSADGNTLAVGGNRDAGNKGAVWIYTRSSGTWTQQGAKLVGAGSAGGILQGWSIALSADGNTLAMGARLDETMAGSVWIFTRSGSTWTQQGGKLVGTGAIGYSRQGNAVALSADGNTLVSGGYSDDTDKGAVWVFTRSGSTWSQQGSKLVGSGAVGNARQGTAVALSADGNTLAIGGSPDNGLVGAVWMFTRNGGTWTQDGNKLVGAGAVGNAQQGTAVSLGADGNTLAIGGPNDNDFAGATWLFTRNGGTWAQQGNKVSGTGFAGYPRQGGAVALSANGQTLAAPGWADNTWMGAAWVYVPLTPPAGLSYTPASNSYFAGVAITALTPTVTGVVNSYSVSPALPAGLTINTATGVISGTPTAAAAASYTITATNTAGSTSATINITVAIPLPPTINSFTPERAHVGATVTISGTRFSTTPTKNAVFFGGVKATPVSATATTLTVAVPTGAQYGYLRVVNTETGLAAISPQPFMPTFAAVKPEIFTTDFTAAVNYPGVLSVMMGGLADLDGDGKLDLIMTNHSNGSVGIQRNLTTGAGALSSGSFGTQTNFAVGAPIGFATADFDNDGKLDIAIATNYNNKVSVFRNTTSGPGAFSSSSLGSRIDLTTGGTVTTIATADVDGDGKTDIIANDATGKVAVFRNINASQGNLTQSSFETRVDYAMGAGPRGVAAGDIDGDGRPEIVSANMNTNTVSVLRNNITAAGTLSSSSFASQQEYTVGTGPRDVRIADVDNDGRPDLIAVNYTTNNISVLRNLTTVPGPLGSASFDARMDYAVANGPNGMMVGDLNGDGKPEIVAIAQNSNGVSILRNTTSGGGSLSASSFAAQVFVSAGSTPQYGDIGDVDGDGKADIVVGSYSSVNASILRNNPVPPPVVSNFFPAKSAPGATIAISGTGFTGVTAVRINGVAVQSFTVETATQITAVVSAGNTSGVVSVINANGSGSTSGAITILRAPALAYANNSYSFLLNTIITPIATPQNTGGTVPQMLAGKVSTLAGSGMTGAADNNNALAATFDGPVSVATDPAGNIYVADMGNHLIRKITPAGAVSTFAGTGSAGFSDNAVGTLAQFNGPVYVATDVAGNVYVTDFFNHRIRKITPAGAVSTLAGSGSQGYADNATGSLAQFNYPIGIAVDVSGNVYVADKDNQRIRKVTPAGAVSTIAGSGTIGYLDHATGTQAQFRYPISVAVAASGDVFVADQLNSRIRKISVSGAVTTVAGDGTPGNSNNSNGLLARFGQPRSLALDVMGNLYVADETYHNIRKVSPSGAVTTVAGNGLAGFADADSPLQGQFNNPPGITVDGDGNLLVADFNNRRIRKVQLTGYAISPALPTGLSLNNDGTISGTPTAASSAANYTVTGTNQAGGSSVVANIAVLITPTIAALPNINKVYGDPAITLTDPTSNSGGAFTYTSSDNNVAVISGNQVTIVGVGTATITASQAASGNYATGSTTATLTVSAATPVISVVPNTPVLVTYGAATQSLQPSSASTGGAYTYSSSNAVVAAVSSTGVISFGNVGNATITVSQAAAGNYTTGTLTVPVTVMAATPVISVAASPVNLTYGGSGQNLQATSASSGTYTYSSSNPAAATVDASGNIGISGAGNATITINQAATGNYNAASLSVPVAVAQASPTVGTLSLPAITFGDPAFVLTDPASTSGGAFSYTSSNSSVVATSGNTVTIIGAGTATITAVQAATTNHTPGSVQAMLTVAAASPVITPPAALQKVMGSGTFQLSPPASTSNGVWTWSSNNSNVATINGNTVTLIGLGQATVTATQAATANYRSGSTSFVLTVVSGNPGLANFTVAAKTFGDAPFALNAPSSLSNGAFTYSSSDPSVATISGNTVTITGGGSAVITATQAAWGFYPAASTSAVLSVTKANPVITAPASLSKTFGDAPFVITAPVSNSAGVWSYTSSNNNVASVNGATLTITGAGSAVITATQAATANYTAGSTTFNVTVARASPLITTAAAINKVYGDVAFALSAPASNSEGLFSYTSSNTGVVTVNGNTVTVVGAGVATITAAQAATNNYSAGQTTITVSIAKANPWVVTPAVMSSTYGDAPFTIAAPASNSNGVWTFASNNSAVAAISGNTLTITGAGTALITATQAATANYDSGTTTVSLTVGRANPVITTHGPTGKVYGDGSFALSMPSSTSPGTWSFGSSNNSVVAISGNTVTITGAGTATITATQAATTNYNGGSASISVTIGRAPLTVSVANNYRCVGYANPQFGYTITGFVNREDAGVLQSMPVAGTSAAASSPAGVYPITASGASAANYTVSYVAGVLTVNNPQNSPRRLPVVDAIAGEPTQLNGRMFGARYQWAPATGLSNDRIAMPMVTLSNEVTYTIATTEATGCVVTDTLQVRTFSKPDVFVPSLFSPNGDGVNDELRINPVGLKQLTYFRVLDKRGRVVFQTSNLNAGWNGRYGGTLLPMDTYSWILYALDKNGKVVTAGGSVTLAQ